MSRDKFSGDDQNAVRTRNAEGLKDVGSATGLFSTLPAEPPKPSDDVIVPEANSPAAPRAREAAVPPPPAPFIRGESPLPKLHEIVFHPTAATSESNEALLGLLRSSTVTSDSGSSSSAGSATPSAPPFAPPTESFTQLLQALGEPADQLQKAKPPVPGDEEIQGQGRTPEVSVQAASPRIIASLTQLLRIGEEPGQVDATAADGTLRPASSASSMLPVVEQSPARNAKHGTANLEVNRSVPGASSASQVTSFKSPISALKPSSLRPDSPQVAPSVPSSSESPSFTQMFAVSQRDATSATPSPAPAESFTQMLKVLDESPLTDVDLSTASKPVFTSRIPENLANRPTVSGSASVAVPEQVQMPQAPGASAGSFTRLFNMLETEPPKTEQLVAPPLRTEKPEVEYGLPVSSQVLEPSAKVDPHSFTQMFDVLPEPATNPQVLSEARRSSSFTQMFAAPDQSTMAPLQASAAIFDQATGPVAAEAPAHLPLVRANLPVPPEREPVSKLPMPALPTTSAPPVEGLTQLLRTLDEGPAASSASYLPPVGVPSAAPLTPSAPFSKVFDKLDQAPLEAEKPSFSSIPPKSPSAVPHSGRFASPLGQDASQVFNLPLAPQALPASPHTGPSEFTSVLNASSLREAGLRAEQAALPTSSSSQSINPQGLGALHPSMPLGASLTNLPGMPIRQSLPPVSLPRMTAPAPPPTVLHKYLPLLLLGVIFLLLVLLVAVFFLHKG